jgi:branched-chain amino acid transport system substrate-binding protein
LPISGSSFRIRRRTFFGAGLAAGALQVFSPFVRTARAADAVKIGLDNPLTGPLASLGKNELIGCQMARKLIGGERIDFLLGNTNSALSLAMAEVSNEQGILHIVPGGHTDAVTGASCHWNVFRVCSTTQMEANAVAGALIKAYGKKFYYITSTTRSAIP